MRIGLIGAGSMATALARGWGEPVLVTDVVPDRARSLADEVDGEVAASAGELAERADLVVLCHKPAQLAEVAGQAADARAVASVLAATPLEQLEQAYPSRPVYRFIPSIPVEVGAGVLCYAGGKLAAQGPEEAVLELFRRLGSVISLDEPLIEPAMALMSCGPAFLALVVEAFTAAGARHGLEPGQAARMTVETMAGTAAYLRERGLDAAALRERVATPGGVTERGLEALERAGLASAIDDAVDTVVGGARE